MVLKVVDNNYTPEVLRDIEDAEWWKMIGRISGLRLSGFTFRSSALFIRDVREVDGEIVHQQSIEMSGYIASLILNLYENQK